MRQTREAREATAVAIIPCSGAKLDEAAPAENLYQGSAFKVALAAALDVVEGDRSRVRILSALYGLVGLDTVLSPYNVKMGDAGSVRSLDTSSIGDDDDVYAFLPKAYYAVLDAALRERDIYASDVYEAAPGIGYQRGTCRTAQL